MTSTDYLKGREQGVEDVLGAMWERFERDLSAFHLVIHNWSGIYYQYEQERHPQAWTKTDEVNRVSFRAWKSAIAMQDLIEMFGDTLSITKFVNEIDRINDFFEQLSSWDLHVNFGWKQRE